MVAASREDDSPPEQAVRVATVADRLGYREVWLGEGPTWDAFVLGTAVGLATERIAITAGPIPVSVRDPASIVRGAAGAEALVGRAVGVALGASSVRVVEGVHGRSRARVATVLAESTEAVRALLDHQRAGPGGEVVPGGGFRQRLAGPTGPLTVAAFGDRAIAVAARYADRMVLDLVTPEQVRELRAKLDAAALGVGRRPPTLAAWLPAAVDPTSESYAQILGSIAGYLTVRGYREVFLESGLEEAVRLADRGADRHELLAALPERAARTVGLVGDLEAVRARTRVYADAGLDEIALVPATAGDPDGERTLTACAHS
ncbi:MAG: LLM class F420-dependent oxidoreductase [Pseudonocardia sp.]|nr:LLM class F420-dependent oxidoreductase [Pseudonocardia sp.]MBO0874471.1 LLM class F420-dependent oxidoreductase [Pseudonocardia sp.]